MESKRFPRVNSVTVSPDNPEGERLNNKADGQRAGTARSGNPPPSVDLGGNESPAWQDYFFLAPNVRFTRTPDYEASTRQPRQIASEQGEPHPLPARQAVAQPAAAAKSSVVSTPSLSETMKNRNSASEAARPPTGNRAVTHDRPAAPGARTAVTARAPVPAASAQAVASPVKTPGRETARWPYLSNHVFFELMALYMIESPLPAPRRFRLRARQRRSSPHGSTSTPPRPIRPRCSGSLNAFQASRLRRPCRKSARPTRTKPWVNRQRAAHRNGPG